MWRMKKRNLLYCNIDYVKANIRVSDNNVLIKLSKGSNSFYVNFLSYKIEITKVDISEKFRYYYIISCNGINIGFIWLWSTWDKKEFIEISGQGMTTYWIDLFYFLMDKLKIEFIKYKRIDLCMDLEMNINYFFERILLDKFKTEKENFSFIKTKRNWYETLYFGKKNIKENSYILNRIYNKIIDSKKKDKLFLYEEYKNEDGTFKEVTRFETELREDLCKFYPYDCLRDQNFVFFRLVKSFFKYNWKYFSFLKDEDFFEAQKRNRINNKINLQKILLWEKTKALSLYQNKIQKIEEEKERSLLYWSGFIDDKDEKTCKSIMVSQAKRLYRNWYSKEDIILILSNNLI